jgi:hypothetical protein
MMTVPMTITVADLELENETVRGECGKRERCWNSGAWLPVGSEAKSAAIEEVSDGVNVISK